MAGRERALGVMATGAAFTIWGLAPVYYKLVAQVDSWELLAHRIIWSLAVLGLIAAWRWESLRSGLNRVGLKGLLLTAALIGANWLLIIWAVQLGRVTEISLGFFINPLASVLLGVLILKESLGRARGLAVGLAAMGVAVLVISHGQAPWLSLGLALTFSLYGLVRKVLAVQPLGGLLVETGLMAPLALGYLFWLGGQDGMVFAHESRGMDLLLALAGVLSVAPLAFFLMGVKRLTLSTVGIIQYIAPSLNLFLAVAVYDEPFTVVHLAAFSLIWSALAIYSLASWQENREAVE